MQGLDKILILFGSVFVLLAEKYDNRITMSVGDKFGCHGNMVGLG